MATWIQEHLQLIIVVGGAIAYWLNQRKALQEGGEEGAPGEQSFEDPESAARARRIREDIQRKIEQRTGGRGPEPAPVARSEPPELPPLFQELLLGRPAQPEPRIEQPHTVYEARRHAEILEQQAALTDQLKQAKEMKALSQRREKFQASIANHDEANRMTRNRALTDELRDPAALRRAFILREVLGPPVALR